MLKVNKIRPSKAIHPILPTSKNQAREHSKKTEDGKKKPDTDDGKVNIKHIDERV